MRPVPLRLKSGAWSTWSFRWNRFAGKRLYVKTSVKIPQDAPFTVDVANNSYWRPEPGGVIIGWVDSDEPVSQPSEKVHPDWEFPAITLDKVKRMTPFFEEVEKTVRQPDMNTSAGFYVYTPDDQPLIGSVPEVPGFYVNCGYWAGVMLSPEAGKRIGDLVTGKMASQRKPVTTDTFQRRPREKRQDAYEPLIALNEDEVMHL